MIISLYNCLFLTSRPQETYLELILGNSKNKHQLGRERSNALSRNPRLNLFLIPCLRRLFADSSGSAFVLTPQSITRLRATHLSNPTRPNGRPSNAHRSHPPLDRQFCRRMYNSRLQGSRYTGITGRQDCKSESHPNIAERRDKYHAHEWCCTDPHSYGDACTSIKKRPHENQWRRRGSAVILSFVDQSGGAVDFAAGLHNAAAPTE